MEQTLLLTTAYLPPIQYISKFDKNHSIFIEQYENYGKQSYRNRCRILSANGVMPLIIPVIKATNKKILTKDVKIDYATNWQKLHLKGIESAYKNSPFYDYYIDDLLPYFHSKEIFLLDFNMKILDTLSGLLQIDLVAQLTSDYMIPTEKIIDLRESIHPKISKMKEDPDFIDKPYHQTFSDRFPFIPNLSIIDLLFNEGPESYNYL